jgi:hypothetical protein
MTRHGWAMIVILSLSMFSLMLFFSTHYLSPYRGRRTPAKSLGLFRSMIWRMMPTEQRHGQDRRPGSSAMARGLGNLARGAFRCAGKRHGRDAHGGDVAGKEVVAAKWHGR